MRRIHTTFQRLVLSSTLLVAGPLLHSVSAQDMKRSEESAPGASDVTFEWQYSCPSGKACSFTCPGSGGASNVTKLTLQLGASLLAATKEPSAYFISFRPCKFRVLTALASRRE